MFKINNKLRESIFSIMPENYSKLEKAVFIYYQLCKKLNYSMDYYLEDEQVKSYYTNIENLADIDGEERTDVVCFTFNAICGQLFVDAGILSEEFLKGEGMFADNSIDRFHVVHQALGVAIDENLLFDCDATYGIVDNNDLINMKYKPSFEGWECYGDDKAKEAFKKAVEKVTEREKSLSHFEEEYLKLKSQEKSLQDFSLEERRDLFLKMAVSDDVPKYSVLTFNYLLKLKHLLFKKEEFSGKLDRKAEVLFVKDKLDNQLKCLFVFNKDGYTDDKGYEDFESLQIYEISLADKSILEVKQSDFAQRREERYFEKFSRRSSMPEMLKEGKIYLQEVYEGGKAVYDESQKATNVVGYLRNLIEEGRQVKADAQGNILG